MFGIFKYLWTVVFFVLLYFGWYFGMPFYQGYQETEAIYKGHNFYEGKVYKEEYRVPARKMLAEGCKYGVRMRDVQQFACREPEKQHLWEKYL